MISATTMRAASERLTASIRAIEQELAESAVKSPLDTVPNSLYGRRASYISPALPLWDGRDRLTRRQRSHHNPVT
jgi:hypothetical protein